MRRSLAALLILMGCGDSTGPSGTVATVAFVQGAEQRAVVGTELPQAIVVRVSDADGQAVSGQPVIFVVVGEDGHVSHDTVRTTEAGEAETRWTLGTESGDQFLQVRAVNQFGKLVAASLKAIGDPGPAAALTFTPAAHTIRTGEQLDVAPSIQVADEYGNVITDPPVFQLSAAPPLTIDGTTVSSAEEVAGLVTVTSGAASGTVPVNVLLNLDELDGAVGSYECNGRKETTITSQGQPLDVVLVHSRLTFDIEGAGPALTDSTVANLAVRIERYVVRDDGNFHLFISFITQPMPVLAQEPGRLVIAVPAEDGSEIQAELSRTSPLTYQGGPFCAGWSPLDSFQPITITEE